MRKSSIQRFALLRRSLGLGSIRGKTNFYPSAHFGAAKMGRRDDRDGVFAGYQDDAPLGQIQKWADEILFGRFAALPRRGPAEAKADSVEWVEAEKMLDSNGDLGARWIFSS
ncbi:MAG: hypothetical protein IPN95_09520 [Bacteroidetes bacterium]|nr:hypothetical protein [Bacteroidota bacterium]